MPSSPKKRNDAAGPALVSALGRLRLGLLGAVAALAGLACEPAAPSSRAVAPAAPAPVATAAAAARPVEPAPSARGLFWRADVGASTLYLLGSVHVARPDIYPLDPRIEGAFAESDVLVLELSLDESAQISAARRMMELGRLPPGKRLSDVVQPQTWALLERTQAERGQSMFGLRGFRPWFVALTLTTQALEREGFSAANGIDEHFRRAAEGHKRIEALETVEGQLDLFASSSPEAEEQLLRQTLEEIDEYATELDAAFRLWSAGDAPGLDRLMVSPMASEYPEMFERLFAARNRAMTERLAEMVKAPARYFVVVGAGHLVGRVGIVELLGARGIASRQL
jgi:uncharacterized protein YbaP (TraB family)